MNKERILQVLSGIINVETDKLINYPENTKLAEIGLDSIKFIQFIVGIEDEFNIQVLDSDLLLSNFETIEKVLMTLQKYFSDNSPLKKVIVCDCDNVLWNGVAGEEKIYIDDNNQQLQETLTKLYGSGVLICLCSKNNTSDIDGAFTHQNMILKKDQIAVSKINFRDKASNIKEISNELNLSLDSFVFLDDSDYELGLINSFLPEVQTVKVNYNDLSFINEINALFSENSSSLDRTKLYKEQKEREKEKLKFKTVQEYNDSLETKVFFRYDKEEDASRVSELTQRTNQFNLSGKRYSTQEISDIIDSKSVNLLTLSVSDKYGDMGIIGAAIYEIKENAVIIYSFYLSCRAFGRGFEKLMIDELKKTHKPVFGIYNETAKNIQHKTFYEENGVSLYEL